MRSILRRRQTVKLKSPAEIDIMRQAGRLVRRVLDRMHELAQPGVTTAELNAEAERMIAAAGAEALFRGVETPQTKFPFPTALCTSVNAQVVHGIPSNRVLREGDVVSIDCGVRVNGFCGDSATTIAIGQPSPEVERLLQVTAGALELAVREIRPKRWWSEVASQMQTAVESAGFSVVRQFVGHGIGREMHEEPKVPNYVDPREKSLDFLLTPGLVIAVEPMVNMGTAEVQYEDASNWPVVTADGKYAAHFEHTVAVTDRGCDVLTDGR